MEAIARLDQKFAQANLSPDGYSDLLATTFFIVSWKEYRDIFNRYDHIPSSESTRVRLLPIAIMIHTFLNMKKT